LFFKGNSHGNNREPISCRDRRTLALKGHFLLPILELANKQKGWISATSLAILSAQHPWLFLFVPFWLILLPVGTGEGLRDLIKKFLTKLSSPPKPRAKQPRRGT
jgi:hypothetical protein